MAHIQTIGNYQIWESDGHGRSTGKPGNYNKKTTSIQVREMMGNTGYFLRKTYNFPVGNFEKRTARILQAQEFINSLNHKS